MREIENRGLRPLQAGKTRITTPIDVAWCTRIMGFFFGLLCLVTIAYFFFFRLGYSLTLIFRLQFVIRGLKNNEIGRKQ